MKTLPEKLQKIIVTIISITLFFLLGRYAKINTGIEITYVFLQYPLLCIVSIIYGPVVGFLTGFVGHTLIDVANSQYVWYSWVTASALLGLSLGLLSNHFIKKKTPNPSHEVDTKTRVIYAASILCLNIIAFLFIAPVLEIILYHDTIKNAFSRGLFIAISNGLTSAVVTDLFFSSFRHTILRRIVAVLTLIDALVLISYGNHSVGTIILYVITIIFGLYLFFYKRWHVRSKSKIIQILKGIVFFGFIIYVCEILFLAVFAYCNRPLGVEKICIVLGAGLEGEEPSKILQMRLDTAYNWYLEDNDRIIITSGGQGDDEIISEGAAMRNYLIKKGVPESQIYAESASRTTFENFKFSYELMQNENINDSSSIVIVTNNFHCFRARGYAGKAGFANARTLAAPTPIFGVMPNFFREGISFIKYLLA